LGTPKSSNVLLVGGFNPSEKYEGQLGLLFPIYGKIKFMFQTTNQISLNLKQSHIFTYEPSGYGSETPVHS
jgi:hypothetical protein